MTLFVDSSAWYAAVDRGDRDHGNAVEILGKRERLVTSDHVVVESWTLMRVRLGRSVADTFWRRVREGITEVEIASAEDLDMAWSIRQGFPDQDFSVVDLTSFAVMQRLKLNRVASFDEHFSIFRYGKNRRNAFDVIR